MTDQNFKKSEEKIRRYKRLTILWILSCALMIPITAFLLPELPSSNLEKDSFWAGKTDQKPVYDIVYTGDSRIYRGINPGVIDSMLGTTSYNFGFSSAGLDSSLLTAACSLLDPLGKRILLIGIDPNSFQKTSLQNGHLHRWMNKDRKDIWVKKNIYPWLDGMEAYSLSDFVKMGKGEAYSEVFHSASGFVFSGRTPPDSNIALTAYRERLREEELSDEAINNFLKHIEQFESRGIRICVLRMPVPSAMMDLENQLSGFNMSWFAGRRILLEPGMEGLVSYDGSHLDGKSALLFSERLALMLKPLTEGER